MLRIVQNRAASSAKSYYSHGDYLAEGQELAGRWGGKTADLLGVRGLVEQVDFDALCDNRDPRSGKPLTARTKHDRTVGYDFNFHVPKGVSLAYALNQDERILDAFRESVDETMHEIEREAKTRLRKEGRQEDRLTGNLVWAEFVHTTARPVDGIPDPHLHAHCFVFNATYDDKEHRYKAAQFRELKRDAPYFEAAFEARLALRLRGLGYEIDRRDRSWDLAEISASLNKKFSRRTEQIEEKAKGEGITDPDFKAELGRKTREAKRKDLSFSELRQEWLSRLDEGDRDALGRTAHAALAARLQLQPEAASNAMEQAISHCFEREAVVPERSLLAEALRRGVGRVAVEAMPAELNRQGVITRELGGRKMATTQEVLGEERDVLAFARAGKGKAEPFHTGWQFQRDWLNGEQKAALLQLLESRDRVQLLRGGAGTGKTALMQELREAIEAGDKRVLAFAPSAQASRGVLRAEGFEEATTVAELLVNAELQQAARSNVLLIDEAGLLGTRQLKQVFELAERNDARIILAGDWRQHGSVERGGVLRLLEREAGLKPAEVSRIQRQKGQYKAAVAALAKDDILDGFERLDGLGWVQELDDEIRDGRIAHDYAEAAAKGESALVVCPTHREAEHLTDAIRRELRRREQIGAEDSTITRLRPLHLTEAERADPAFYQPGDVIVFQQNAPGHCKGERIVFGEHADKELFKHAPRFSVYRAEALKVSAGDWIRVTANGNTKDTKHRLNNGALYQVAKITGRGDLQLANGWTIDRDFGHVAHGYVSTSHASQGRTVDKVFIAESAESFPAASREQFYVSVSRGRKQATIYTNDKSALRHAIQESSAKLTASELVNTALPQLNAERLRRARQRILAAREAARPREKERELAYGSR